MNLKELYQEIILDHGKNPHNLKKIENTSNIISEVRGAGLLLGIRTNISNIEF